MSRKLFSLFVAAFLTIQAVVGQVLQFGTCPQVETATYFDIESFLGQWNEIERFPTWYEDYGHCAYKRFSYCNRRVAIEHAYIKDGIQFILHLNSTYVPGDEAVFPMQENNVDPVGIPMSIISTDYTNYAVVYGCKNNAILGIKYSLAWILAREKTLPDDIMNQARQELNSIPYANLAYLETVDQNDQSCSHYWTAEVEAVDAAGQVRK